MGLETIDKWSFKYWLIQHYAKFIAWLFYRRIQIVDMKNYPKNEPVILAPNHQNALMDAMAYVLQMGLQPVFLARADVFKGKFLIRVLHGFNILPIYRIRDGISNVKRNDEIFNRTMQIFKNRYNPLVVFPEGNHGDKRRLRPLVKGIFRIAFQAQEQLRDEAGVKILPAGVDYSHYENARETLFINFGEPIEVREYFDAYKADNAKGINQLKERLIREMPKTMLDIRSEEYYDTIDYLRDLVNQRGKNLQKKFKADQQLIAVLDKTAEENPGVLAKMAEQLKKYRRTLKKFHFTDEVFRTKTNYYFKALFLLVPIVVLFPLFLAGVINNLVPHILSKHFVKKIKDTQFKSSVRYMIYLLSLPVYYALFIIPLSFIDINFWYKVAYILFMPFTGIFAFEYGRQVKRLFMKLKYLLFKNNKDIVQARKIRTNLVKEIQALT